MANYVIKTIDDISQFNDRCDEVVTMTDYQATKKAATTLKDTLKSNSDLVALAAPQIGVHQRVFVMRFGKEYKTFMNPIIVNQSKEKFLSEEEFVFSKNPKKFLIHRPLELTVAFQDKLGNVEQLTFKKISVTPVMQMIDLLDGMLEYTLEMMGLELDDTWNKMSKEEKQTVVTNFEEMVKANSEKLAKEIEENDELRAIKEQIDKTAEELAKDVPQKVEESKDETDSSNETK